MAVPKALRTMRTIKQLRVRRQDAAQRAYRQAQEATQAARATVEQRATEHAQLANSVHEEIENLYAPCINQLTAPQTIVEITKKEANLRQRVQEALLAIEKAKEQVAQCEAAQEQAHQALLLTRRKLRATEEMVTELAKAAEREAQRQEQTRSNEWATLRYCIVK